jgi:glycosyltransferase involved in cell wall biosynthesis
VAESRISIIQNGLSSAVGEPVGRSPYPCLVVLGRLVPHKRVEYAMDALAALAPDLPDLRLVVAGRGWWEPQLREYASRLGVAARTDLAGFVSEQRKHELLSRAWVVLVPSLKEGWGLTILEAAARGTPAVAFRTAGGVCDAIRDGRTGLLADDPDDFVAKIRWLLTDESTRQRLGEDSRAYAESFTWTAAGEQLAALVDGVLRKRAWGAGRRRRGQRAP